MSSSMEDERIADLSRNSSEEPLSSRTLTRIRALIVNPSTPDSTISPLFETLTRSLQLSRDPIILHHTLKLLSDLSSHRTALSRLVLDSLRSNALLSAASPRIAADSLDLVASIAERDRSLSPATDELLVVGGGGGGGFASLCFSSPVSVRLWLLRNAERFGLTPYLEFTVFLGFTKDPYPCVRRVALEGLVRLSDAGVIEDEEMIRGCYCRAVALLRDTEDSVRSAAVRAVCAWGRLLAASNPETKSQCSNEVFVMLCSMARDMSMEVRVEAFIALGKVVMVSEDILLQTLSKKVLGVNKEKRSLGQCCGEKFETLASSAAGAFVHGLEDEFFEVRKSACHSLSTLIVLSAQFALEALDLLMDMLNDDTFIVRSLALETLHRMAAYDCLKLQEKHMHMFLGPLVDKSNSIRYAARKILKLVKLLTLELFIWTVDALLESLARYPEDEIDALSALFHIGRNHGKFVSCVVEEISQQIEPTCDGKLDFDNVRVGALIVLAISTQFSGEHSINISPTIFSYAATMLGRIADALNDVMSQSALLAFLTKCSRSTRFSVIDFSESERAFPPAKVIDDKDYSNNNITGSVVMPLPQKIDRASEIHFSGMKDSRQHATLHLDYNSEVHDEFTKSMNAILARVKDTWPLVLSGNLCEVLRILRSCKEELATFDANSNSTGVLAFTLQYLRVIKLLSKVWQHFLPSKFHTCGLGTLDLLLGKLDRRLRELKSVFIGLSKEEELHVLELILVTCTLRLSKTQICCKCSALKRLSSTMSQVENLLKKDSVEPSKLYIEVGKLLSEIPTSVSGGSHDSYLFKKLSEVFCLKKFVVCGRLKHVKAELDVPRNDFENPLSFVPGLPVGISCQITLHNISTESRLWLRMTPDDGSTQFTFLDSSLSEDRDGYRRFSFLAPFYRTPKAMSFTIRLCIGMECPFEDVQIVKGGPKRKLAYLCQERQVFLSLQSNG